MDVPLRTADFCERARTVHSKGVAAVDEPGVPRGLGRLIYGELLDCCGGMIDALDRMGAEVGDRVAIGPPTP